MSKLSEMDEVYEKMIPEEKSYTEPPDGDYQVLVDRVELKQSKAGNDMLSWGFRILGPKHAGAFLWKNSMLMTEQNLQFLRNDLGICGLDCKLSDLEDPKVRAKLLDLKLEVTQKKTGEFTNVYINGKITDGGERSEEAPATPF